MVKLKIIIQQDAMIEPGAAKYHCKDKTFEDAIHLYTAAKETDSSSLPEYQRLKREIIRILKKDH